MTRNRLSPKTRFACLFSDIFPVKGAIKTASQNIHEMRKPGARATQRKIRPTNAEFAQVHFSHGTTFGNEMSHACGWLPQIKEQIYRNRSIKMINHTTAARATEWALSKLGCAYSQDKRTQENTFDCSSLVARAYSAQGKQWKYGGGIPRSNQEVYDDDFRLLWPGAYGEIGKTLGGNSAIALANQPGDLQFLCTDGSTTRANRITHVAMVADKTHIVHARGRAYGVCTNALGHYSGKVCAVTRYDPEGPLRLGMKGFRTLALQQALNKLGAKLNEDGDYGSATARAVREYQNHHGLSVTGEADASVHQTLGLGKYPVISEGSKQTFGSRVRITGNTVNIRTGPGTNYSVAGVARKNEVYDIAETAGWQPILINGKLLWISLRYCASIAPE